MSKVAGNGIITKHQEFYFSPFPGEENDVNVRYIKILAVNEEKALEMFHAEYGETVTPLKLNEGDINSPRCMGTLIQYTENFFKRNIKNI